MPEDTTKVTSNNPPGAPAAGGLKDASDTTNADETSLVLEAMDQLDSDEGESPPPSVGEAVQALAGKPPPGTSPEPAVSPAQPDQAAVPPVQGEAQTPPPPVPPVQAGQQAQQQQPGQEPPPAPQPGQAPGQQAAAQPAQQTPQAGDQDAPRPEEGFAQLAQRFEINREKIIEIVAKEAYPLSEDEAANIVADPSTAIPKLAARIHVNAVSGVLQHVAQQIPAVVHGILQAKERFNQLEGKFFEQWPQLDRTKHREEILRLTRAYRQLNPNAPFDEVSKVVGAQAVVMLGLQGQQPPRNGAQAPPPGRQVQVPFAPAGGAGAPPPNGNQQLQGVALWDQLLDADERGLFDDG